MSQAGVSPLTEAQLRNPVRASIGALPNDGQLALVWLRRGPLVTSPLRGADGNVVFDETVH